MDPAELPRISVDTLQDWNRVTDAFNSALEAALERAIASSGVRDREAVTAHLNTVSL